MVARRPLPGGTFAARGCHRAAALAAGTSGERTVTPALKGTTLDGDHVDIAGGTVR